MNRKAKCSRCGRWETEYQTYGLLNFCEACDDPENRSLLAGHDHEGRDYDLANDLRHELGLGVSL